MQPRAIEGVEVTGGGEELALRHPQRGEIRLRGVAAAVWQKLDGSRSVEELASAVGVEVDAVWVALDELGDADLLVERAAPPAGIHEAIQREVVVVGEGSAEERAKAEQLEEKFDSAAGQLGDTTIGTGVAVDGGEAAEQKAAEGEALAELDALGEQKEKQSAEAPAEAQAEDSPEQAAEQKRKAAELDEEVQESVEEDMKAGGDRLQTAAIAEDDEMYKEKLKKKD